MTQEQFESFVIRVANEKINVTLPNSKAERAAFVMKNMFRTATNHIKLLVCNLDSDITNSPGYNEALEEAIKRKIQVSILYRDAPNNNSSSNKLLDNLEQEGFKNIHRKTLTEAANQKLNSYKLNKDELFLFSEADNRMYRFEFEKEGHKAWFNYNDQDRSLKLSRIFDDVFSSIN